MYNLFTSAKITILFIIMIIFLMISGIIAISEQNKTKEKQNYIGSHITAGIGGSIFVILVIIVIAARYGYIKIIESSSD